MHLTGAEMKMYGGKKVGSEQRIVSAPLPFSACASEFACKLYCSDDKEPMVVDLIDRSCCCLISISFSLRLRQQCHLETLKRLSVPQMVWCLTF